MIEFGLYVPQVGFTWEQIRERALLAEELGFTSVWFMDHLYPPELPDVPSFEAWTVATAVLTATTRLRVGHLVLSNTLRHPALLAKMATTLDVISGGRLDLGIGSGSYPPEHERAGIAWDSTRVRSEQLEEALEIITAMFTGSPTSYEGRHYRLAELPNLPPPVQQPRPPIHVGGAGERRTLPLVARFADVWNCPTYALGELEDKLAIVRSECERVGRDPAALRVSLEAVLALVESDGALPDALARAERRYPGPGWGLHEGGYAGTPEAVVARIQEHADRGITLFVFFTHDRAAPDTLRLFADRVMPAFSLMTPTSPRRPDTPTGFGPRLAGKVALISGIASGQGRAAALLFARHGAIVVGSDLEPRRGPRRRVGGTRAARRRRARRCAPRARGSTWPTRTTSPPGCSTAVDRFGCIDVLYNNAGFGLMGMMHEMPLDQWRATMRGELDTVFVPCKHAIPHMRRTRAGRDVDHQHRVGVGDDLDAAAGHARRDGARRGQGRRARDDAQPRPGVRAGRHPRQRDLTGLGRHAVAGARGLRHAGVPRRRRRQPLHQAPRPPRRGRPAGAVPRVRRVGVRDRRQLRDRRRLVDLLRRIGRRRAAPVPSSIVCRRGAVRRSLGRGRRPRRDRARDHDARETPAPSPPVTGPGGVTIEQGITYQLDNGPPGTPLQPELLDAYLPPKTPGVTRPAVVLVHGGGWAGGSRTVLAPEAQQLAEMGWASFTIDYRLEDDPTQLPWTDELDDVQAAVRFVAANAKRFDLDPQRIGMIGASAGGHLVGLVATLGTLDDTTGHDQNAVPGAKPVNPVVVATWSGRLRPGSAGVDRRGAAHRLRRRPRLHRRLPPQRHPDLRRLRGGELRGPLRRRVAAHARERVDLADVHRQLPGGADPAPAARRDDRRPAEVRRPQPARHPPRRAPRAGVRTAGHAADDRLPAALPGGARGQGRRRTRRRVRFGR